MGGSDKFWIVWNVNSNKPPTLKFYSLKQAMKVRDILKAKQPNDDIFVMETVMLTGLGQDK